MVMWQNLVLDDQVAPLVKETKLLLGDFIDFN